MFQYVYRYIPLVIFLEGRCHYTEDKKKTSVEFLRNFSINLPAFYNE